MIRLVSRGVAQGQFRDVRLGRITTAAVDPDASSRSRLPCQAGIGDARPSRICRRPGASRR